MTKPNKIKTVIIFDGYVETQSNAGLILTHGTGFAKKNQALESLAYCFGVGHGDLMRDDRIDSDTTVKKANSSTFA